MMGGRYFYDKIQFWIQKIAAADLSGKGGVLAKVRAALDQNQGKNKAESRQNRKMKLVNNRP